MCTWSFSETNGNHSLNTERALRVLKWTSLSLPHTQRNKAVQRQVAGSGVQSISKGSVPQGQSLRRLDPHRTAAVKP